MKNPVLQRISEYLQLGGLFNPEMMDPVKVQELLIDAGKEIERLEEKAAEDFRNNYERDRI